VVGSGDGHDRRDGAGWVGDADDGDGTGLARSRSAIRQACEQYGPLDSLLDSLSQARQKSWKQSMVSVVSCRVVSCRLGLKEGVGLIRVKEWSRDVKWSAKNADES